jgi:hypothetical protein
MQLGLLGLAAIVLALMAAISPVRAIDCKQSGCAWMNGRRVCR